MRIHEIKFKNPKQAQAKQLTNQAKQLRLQAQKETKIDQIRKDQTAISKIQNKQQAQNVSQLLA